MKKNYLVSIIIVLSTFIVTGVVSSCSSDFDEYNYGSYTLKEKNEIVSLAKEFGLSMEVQDNCYGKRLKRSEIESLFGKISTLLGEYQFIGEENGNKITFYSINKEHLRSIPEELTGYEFVWRKTAASDTLSFIVGIAKNEMSGNYSVFAELEDHEGHNGQIVVSNNTCIHLGFSVNFYVNVAYHYSEEGTNYDFYFVINGTYNEVTKEGEFYVRSSDGSGTMGSGGTIN